VYQFASVVLRIALAYLTGLNVCFSQTANLSKVDSLEWRLSTADGHEKYDLYVELLFQFADKDNQKSFEYALKANRWALESGDSIEITRSGRLKGQLLRRLDRLDEAIDQLTSVLHIAQRNGFVQEEKAILNALAISHNYRANYDKALEYNFRSLTIREQEGNPQEISVALNNIGLVYYKMGNFAQSKDYYERALDIKNKAKDEFALDQLLINMALCYTKLGRFESAKEIAYRAFRLCGENCTEQIKTEGEFALGYSLKELGDYNGALEHLTRSLSIARHSGDKRFQAENLLYLGMIELEKGTTEQALQLLTEAQAISQISGYNQVLIHAYQGLYLAYQELGDIQKTSIFQSRYIQLKDSIYSEELIRNLAVIQSNFAERENIKTIAEQDEILRLNQIVIDRQRQVYILVIVIAIVSVMIALVFLRYSRALSKAKMELSMVNQTLERRVQDRTKALQNVNNELDNFIYKTSHDIRGPLASLKGIANVALLELTDPKAQDYLHKLDASADKLNTILTRLLIVNQINHAVLTPVKIDFPELLQEILTFERKKGIPNKLLITHEIEPQVALTTDRHVLRIILENLIDNAIKYHNSSDRIEPFVKIRVHMNGEGVKIRVIDNGIGIKENDPQKLFQMFVRASERSESGGIGLYLTKLASERLYAKVDYATTLEKFTQFTVTLPLDLGRVLNDREKEMA
jgi:signal transduction histidine kinase